MHPIIHHPLEFHIPLLFHGWQLPVTGFGIAMVLAFVVGPYAAETEMARRGYDARAYADITLGAVIGGLLGAKIYYAILTHDIGAILHRAGFVFWGGLIGGIIGTYYVMVRKKLPFTRISDLSAPGLAASYAVGRTGCWAVGDDYGRPWDGFLSVSFPQGAPPSTVQNLTSFGFHFPANRPLADAVAVHPTQIYEVALAVLMFVVLWRMRDHKHAEGWLFGVYCVLAGAERFVIEIFRAKDDRFFGPFTMAQMIAVAFVAFGLWWMQIRRTVGPGHHGIYAEPRGAA
jgi:phosphatidylglycerol:prolipoprotein diacylglycerol transferase